MFRTLFTSDWHHGCCTHSSVDPVTNVPTRVLDFERSISFVFASADSMGVSRVVNMGDLHHTSSPISTWVARLIALHKQYLNLQRRGEVRWDYHGYDGNHDWAGRAGRKSATAPLVEAFAGDALFFDRFHWYDKVVLVQEWAPGVRALVIPHGSPPVDVEFSDDDKTNIVLCHTTLPGAVSGVEETLLADKIRDLGTITGRVDAYFSGHIHKPQTFRMTTEDGPGALVVYPGSIERIDFGERGEQKGFVVVDLHELREKGEAAIHRVEIPTRPMIQIHHVLGSEDKPWEGRDLKGYLVKVVVSGHERDLGSFNAGEVRKKLLEAGADYVAGFSMEIERERVVKDSGMTERLTSEAALDRYVERNVPVTTEEERRFRDAVLANGRRILLEASRA